MQISNSEPFTRDLVLVGGGHSHALVLLRWAMAPQPGVRVTLISELSSSPYSGMLPGLVAGLYEHGDVHIDLRRLCQHAGARFILARVTGADAQTKQVQLQGRPPIDYDLLSINAGATPDLGVLGAAEFSTPVKPIADFWPRWLQVRDELLSCADARDLVLVGGGAGSVELALAMAHRLQSAKARHRVHLVTRGAVLLPDYPHAMRRWLQRRLQQYGIQVHCGFAVSQVTADSILGGAGQMLPVGHLFWCTQARAAGWFGQSGLAVTDAGFIRVRATLQSVEHEDIFAAGDCAWMEGANLPRAGVYAVRQAPVLYDNLIRRLRGEPLRSYKPQRHFLSLLACGGRDAVGARGWIPLAGNWLWRWKYRIDRRFMAMLQQLPVLPPPQEGSEQSLEPPAMRCGGCGAKVGADVLRQGLAALRTPAGADVLCDTSTPDDAAVIALPTAPTESPLSASEQPALVQSIDALKPLFDDPYIFARVTTLHALSDIFAMHARAHSAQLLVQLPLLAEALQVRDMRQLLAGVSAELQPLGASLLGGHTLEGEGMQLGLTVNGFALQREIVRKGGVQAGDVLVLTKALGTGSIFAAAMRGAAPAAAVDAAIASMLQSNALAADVLAAAGAHALTDITGFGLLGHLLEMLKPSGEAGYFAVGAKLRLGDLPVLPGALETLRAGYRSTLAPANRRARHLVQLEGVDSIDPRYQLLFDPQTSGGLLAALPVESAEVCLERLAAAGVRATIVGRCEGRRLVVEN